MYHFAGKEFDSVMKIRLIEERKQRGWSQKNLADLVGTTRHNVSRWETGQTTPSPYFRAKLCVLFEKNWKELSFSPEYS